MTQENHQGDDHHVGFVFGDVEKHKIQVTKVAQKEFRIDVPLAPLGKSLTVESSNGFTRPCVQLTIGIMRTIAPNCPNKTKKYTSNCSKTWRNSFPYDRLGLKQGRGGGEGR